MKTEDPVKYGSLTRSPSPKKITLQELTSLIIKNASFEDITGKSLDMRNLSNQYNTFRPKDTDELNLTQMNRTKQSNASLKKPFAQATSTGMSKSPVA